MRLTLTSARTGMKVKFKVIKLCFFSLSKKEVTKVKDEGQKSQVKVSKNQKWVRSSFNFGLSFTKSEILRLKLYLLLQLQWFEKVKTLAL